MHKQTHIVDSAQWRRMQSLPPVLEDLTKPIIQTVCHLISILFHQRDKLLVKMDYHSGE